MKKNLTQLVALSLSIFLAGGPAFAAEQAVSAPELNAPAPLALPAVPGVSLDNAAVAAPRISLDAPSASVPQTSAVTAQAAVAQAAVPQSMRAAVLRGLTTAAGQKFSPAAVNRVYGEGSRLNIISPEGELPSDVRAILTNSGYAPVRRRKTGLKLPPGVKPVKPSNSFKGQINSVERSHFAPNQVLEDGSAPTALDVDLNAFDLTKDASMKDAMAAVESALKKAVDADPAKFGASDKFGAPSADMGRVHVQYAPGLVGDPSIYAVFRQWKVGKQKDGSDYVANVDGGVMRFHIKVFKGKPYVMSYSGGFAAIDDGILAARFTDDEMKRIATRQLGQADSGDSSDRTPIDWHGRGPRDFRASRTLRTKEAPETIFIGRQVTPLGADKASTKFRVLDIFQGADMAGHAAIAAVDAQTGEAFVINPQDIRFHESFKGFMGGSQWATRRRAPRTLPESPDADNVSIESAPGAEAGTISGRVLGRGNTLSTGEDHGPVAAMPLAHAFIIDDATGKVVAVTDSNGDFSIPESVSQGRAMTLRVGTQGIYSPVKDADDQDADLGIRMQVSPGQKAVFTLNPSQDDEQLTAVINSYVHVYGLVDWIKAGLKDLGISDSRFDEAIVGVIANSTAMALNAFFDPATKTLNLMKRGSIQQKARDRQGGVHVLTITGENTAQPSVIKHEDTHSLVGAASQYDLTDEQRQTPKYQYVANLVDAVMGSDTNEGTADIGSNLNRDNAEIGNGFLVSVETEDGRQLPLPQPNDIRNATNQIPYEEFDPNNPRSDPHASGNTLMGTAWMAYQDLIPSLGKDQALKAAFRHFFLTCLYIQPASAASALSHLIIEGLRADGSNPFAEIIRRRAQDDHQLKLPPDPAVK